LPPEHVGRHFRATYSAEGVAHDPAATAKQLRDETKRAKAIWIDIDCDVFDPAFFPAVSHPQPFGLAPAAVLRLIDAVWCDRVAGVSISEFDPGRDRADQSLSTLVWLL